jgi:hypothetical protein
MYDTLKKCVVLLMAAVAGCDSSGPRYMRAWGEVSYDGQTLDGGSIVFTPLEGTAGPARGCTLDKIGYDLPAKEGLIADGTYRVEIVHLKPSDEWIRIPDNPKVLIQISKNYIPPMYNVKSTLKVTVSGSSSANQFDFKLKKPSK